MLNIVVDRSDILMPELGLVVSFRYEAYSFVRCDDILESLEAQILLKKAIHYPKAKS